MTAAQLTTTRSFDMVEATLEPASASVLLKRSSVGPEPGAPKGTFRVRFHSLDEMQSAHGHHATRASRWSASMCAALRWAVAMLQSTDARAGDDEAGS